MNSTLNIYAPMPEIFADVPIPFHKSGKISAVAQEKYVRWLRGQNVAGVLIWSAVGHGDRIDVEEREEIYATWRAGLNPNQRIFVALPAGFAPEVPLRAIGSQASHARELGADGFVIWHSGNDSTRHRELLQILA